MKKQNKGITLVALVITIIVLIILAGVSINAIMSDGLIDNAKTAKEDYNKGQVKEERELGKLEQEIENAQGKWKQEGITITNIEDPTIVLEVGEYVAYTPNTAQNKYTMLSKYSGYEQDKEYTQDALKWRVLGVNEYGRLELISDEVTSEKIYLKEYQGYNNGVYLLNDMCEKLYSNTEDKSVARSINMEDIMKVAKFDYTDDEEEIYGVSTGSFTGTYPKILAQEKGQKVNGKTGKLGTSQQDELIEQTQEEWKTAAELELTGTSFAKSKTILYGGLNFESAFVNPKYSDLFILDATIHGEKFTIANGYEPYYLATRYVYTVPAEGAAFGLLNCRICGNRKFTLLFLLYRAGRDGCYLLES